MTDQLATENERLRYALAGHLFDGESLSTREAIRSELIQELATLKVQLTAMAIREAWYSENDKTAMIPWGDLTANEQRDAITYWGTTDKGTPEQPPQRPTTVRNAILEEAALALENAREYGGTYGQKLRRPSNYASAARHVRTIKGRQPQNEKIEPAATPQ